MDQVIDRVLRGDHEAYGEIVEQHYSMLLVFANYRLADSHLAEDVVQQTFIRAYEQLAEFRIGSDMGVWLRSICRFLALGALKSKLRDRDNRAKYRTHLEAHLAQQAIENQEEDGDVLELLKGCRENLSVSAGEAVTLKYDEDYSVKDIATRLERSVSWVTTTLSRARKLLRDCVEKHAEGESHD